MSKSADAFRTISEVAEWLDTPAHVLRFWESKFTQVKPVKRAGGRRYYRPADMRLLGGIKKLLHEDGMTIKGVQKILREQGIKHVSSLCGLALSDEYDYDEVILQDVPASEPIDTVVPFTKPAEDVETVVETSGEAEQIAEEITETVADVVAESTGAVDDTPEPPEEEDHPISPEEIEVAAEITDVAQPFANEPQTVIAEAEFAETAAETAPATPVPDPEGVPLPGFLQRSMEERIDEDVQGDTHEEDMESTDSLLPPVQQETGPGAITYLASIRALSPESARQIAPIVERLKSLAR